MIGIVHACFAVWSFIRPPLKNLYISNKLILIHIGQLLTPVPLLSLELHSLSCHADEWQIHFWYFVVDNVDI